MSGALPVPGSVREAGPEVPDTWRLGWRGASGDSVAARLPGLIKDLQSVTIDGGPHNIAWTHADKVNPALLEFLRC